MKKKKQCRTMTPEKKIRQKQINPRQLFKPMNRVIRPEALYMKNNETQFLENEILKDEIEKKYTKKIKKYKLKKSELKSK